MEKSGKNLYGYKYAGRIPTNSDQAKEGGLVITNEGRVGHVAVVTEVRDDSIVIEEANYIRGKITKRVIAKGSNVIKGYNN